VTLLLFQYEDSFFLDFLEDLIDRQLGSSYFQAMTHRITANVMPICF